MGWLYFYLGITVGTLLGVGIMCLLSYAKEPRDFPEKEAEAWGETRKPL